MKKTLTALLAVSAVSVASAANINWTIAGSTTRVAYGVTATSADATSAANSTTALAATIYLLVADSVDDLATDALGGNSTESAFLSKIGNLTANSAYSTSDGKKPSVTDVAVTSDKIKTTQQTYAMLVYSTDSYGNGWYKIVTTPPTSGYGDGAAADAQTKINPSWNNIATGTWNKAWETSTEPVTPEVPEPATGALALAGVALLFKRRRA